MNLGPVVARLDHYEAGKMTPCETSRFFQDLLDSGLIWYLQGHYHRTLEMLIFQGDVTRPKNKKVSNDHTKQSILGTNDSRIRHTKPDTQQSKNRGIDDPFTGTSATFW